MLRAARFPALLSLRLAGAMGLLALALSLWALARSAGLSPWQQILVPVTVLVSGPIIEQAVNGVETGWAMAVGIGLVAACLARRPDRSAIAAGLLPWLRPDLAPMAGLLLIAALWKGPQSVRLRTMVIAAIVFMPWPLWLYAQTGSWIPQTMVAKAAFYATSCQPIMEKLSFTGLVTVAWLLLLFPASFLAAAWVAREPVGRIGIGASLITLAAYAVTFPVGLWHNHQRYMFPIGLPWIALGLSLAVRSPKFAWRIAAVVVLVSSILLLPTRERASQGPERLLAAQRVREHVDPQARLMVQDAGVFSVFTPNPLIDFVGLKTPSSIETHRLLTWSSCGQNRVRAIAEIARSSQAQFLIITTEWDTSFSITAGLTAEGLQLRELRSPPRGEYGYRIYEISEM